MLDSSPLFYLYATLLFLFFKTLLHFNCVCARACVCVCVCVCVCAMVLEWRSEDNLWKSVLSFPHVGPGNGTQVIRFGGRLAEPSSVSFNSTSFFFSFYSLVLFLLLVPFCPFVKFNLSFYILTF